MRRGHVVGGPEIAVPAIIQVVPGATERDRLGRNGFFEIADSAAIQSGGFLHPAASAHYRGQAAQNGGIRVGLQQLAVLRLRFGILAGGAIDGGQIRPRNRQVPLL